MTSHLLQCKTVPAYTSCSFFATAFHFSYCWKKNKMGTEKYRGLTNKTSGIWELFSGNHHPFVTLLLTTPLF
jgi:hypothetical protein